MTAKLLIVFSIVIGFSVRCDELNYESLEPYRRLINGGILDKLVEYYEDHPTQKGFKQCAKDVLLWKTGFGKRWAWEMSDAAGKFPHSVLRGNIYTFGHYDQCLFIDEEVNNRSIKGKYCPIKVALPNITLSIGKPIFTTFFPDSSLFNQSSIIMKYVQKVSFTWGICIPHSCQTSDIMDTLNFFAKMINMTRVWFRADESKCSTEGMYKLNGFDISAILVAVFFVIIILLSTVYDVSNREKYMTQRQYHDILISFSIYTNTKKLLKVDKSSTNIRCIHGIRVLTMLWAIIIQRYTNQMDYPIQNLVDLESTGISYPAMIFVGSSVFVDTFFLLSGLLLAYLFCVKNESNPFNVGLLYLHRFLRLWPALAALLYFHLTIYKFLVKSPQWPEIYNDMNEPCEKYWWSTLLFVQNYVNPKFMCMKTLWNLQVDAQLHLLSPILLIPIVKFSRKTSFINIIFWIVVTQIMVIVTVYLHNWAAVFESNKRYWNYYYVATQTRATVWLVGFLTGFIIYQTRNRKIKINKYLALFIWCVALTMMLFIIFAIKSLVGHNVNQLQDSTYLAFSRTGWALALSWIIFACSTGYGSIVNWFFSFRFWEIIGKLSYSMYLWYHLIQITQLSTAKSAQFFRHMFIIYFLFADIILTVVLSYIWAMAFEYPFAAIERALFYKSIKFYLQKLKKNPIGSELQITNSIESIDWSIPNYNKKK